ncbi:YraN family protein [Arthrobacter sp. zg-Y1171]|uniref:YraN family protein n=1 Tax=unclassified Arthrobacter TaxID=235627 RepID=UPI002105C0FF|nr:YraN family protein [Arthrobacter sp. zg-Y1171]MCQ1947331.1 YraN family protein [Arthrobacter sp. zg-Y1116]MCQ1995183.1 YraN family protein [Arthrobacter sp. zg-Y1171]UWX80773.1 YraN family protein [Arthrobacter sp. zg-Y1171]
MVDMKAKDILGSRGEELAARYLTDAGLRIIDRNWRCPEGEIDLVAVDGATLVVVEVKTRSSLDFGHPFEAIGQDKVARLYQLAGAWARANSRYFTHRRIDAVSILDDGANPPVVEHLRGIS